jgi:hypothetical protein
MAKGFLYIAENSSMTGLLKIGRTEKVPSARLAELFTTGVPEPFEIAYYALVQDSKKSEMAAHNLLSRYRHKANREFFAIGIGAAIRAIRAIEPPEHEWLNPERSPLESLRDSSNHLIDLVSRHEVASEEKELEEFAQVIQDNNLHPFVLSAFYDSNSGCCQFTLAECVKEFSHLADEIMAVAQEAIVQFDWFGSVYQGRDYSEDDLDGDEPPF